MHKGALLLLPPLRQNIEASLIFSVSDAMGALLSAPVTAIAAESCRVAKCWSASSASMQGWRKTHEDAHIFQCSAAGNGEEGGEAPVSIFAVLDGHGGQAAAGMAKDLLQQLLVGLARRGIFADEADASEDICCAFMQVDSTLRVELPADDRSGTTCIAAVITQTQPGSYCVRMAHCGDSRGVICSSGRLIASEDHKPGRPDEEARIRAAGGTVECGPVGGPQRVDGALAVSRAFGDFHFKPVGMDPTQCKVTCYPEVQTVTCSPGDWVLLACDGIFDVFSNEDVREFLESQLRASGDDPVDGMAVLQHLFGQCLERGSKDNCTAQLIQLLPDCSAQPYMRNLHLGDVEAAVAQDVRQKYMDFFRAEGFEQEANNLLRQTAPSPALESAPSDASNKQAGAMTQSSSSGTASPESASSSQIAALARAVRHMRSTRAIQRAWRRRRGGRDADAGSSADDGL